MVRSLKKPKKSKRKSKGSKETESSSSSVLSAPAKVWQPDFDELEEGEELKFDPSAYNYLRGFSIGWSCLWCSWNSSSWNYIGIFKLSNISGKKCELLPGSSADNDTEMNSESSSDDDEDENEAGEYSQPVLLIWDVRSHLNALAESERVTGIGDNNIH